MTEQQCSNCRFYLERERSNAGFARGYCRRFPPQLVAYSDNSFGQEFPTVSPSDWCGEHRSPYEPPVIVEDVQ